MKYSPNDPVLIRFFVDKHPQLTCSASASVLPLGLNIRLYILRKCWSVIGHSFCGHNKSHGFKMFKTATVGFRANSQLLWAPPALPPSVLTINPCMSLLVPFSHFPPILCNSCSLSFSPGRDSLVQEIRAGAAKQLNKNGSYKRGALTLQRLTYIIPSL